MTRTSAASALAQRYTWLTDALGAGSLVLTSSRRLARELRVQYDLQQQLAGKLAWQTPAIAFWHDWLARSLQESELPDAPSFADGQVSGILWEAELVRAVEQRVLTENSFVRQAVLAWQRLNDWGVALDDVRKSARRPEEVAFARAAIGYKDELRRRGWMDGAQLAGWAEASLRYLRTPVRVMHVGFDRIPPSLSRLFAALEASGVRVVRAPETRPQGKVAIHACQDTDAEFRTAGAWARGILARDPAARVAVVATDLESQPEEYARLLREGLVPGWQQANSEYRHAVNVSYGRQLAEYPAIATALLWSSWLSRDLGSVDVSILIRSPFNELGDQGTRSPLDLALRSMPDRAWTPRGFLGWAKTRTRENDLSTWLAAVDRLAAIREQLSGRAAPAVWAERLAELLQFIGWPGAGPLSSEDFQLLNRWRQLLNELASLGRVLPGMTAAEATARLGRMAADALYQPETGPAQVSLMGALETSGLEFDHIWVAGCDSSRWPAPGNPLTLVSTRLQRDYGMPDCTPADSLAFSRRLLQRLAAGASDVRFSWPRNRDDSLLSASRLLDEIQARRVEPPPDPGWYANGLLGIGCATAVDDDVVPAVMEREKIAGGAYTVQRQLVEPFSAFAVGRLGVSEIAPFEPGIAPSLRGTITHAALDALYAERPDLATLSGWSNEETSRRIRDAAGFALRRHFVHADPVLRRLLSLEEARVRQVLAEFIDFERSRSEFSVVGVEERIEFTHARVELGLRADRIDQLPDGRLLVVDYKTGAVKPLIGSDGDPAEMQLVVYALALDAPVAAIALMFVGGRGVEIRAAGDCEWDRTPAELWPDRIGRWKAIAMSAIEAIAAGDGRVNLRQSSDHSRPLNVLSRAEELKREHRG